MQVIGAQGILDCISSIQLNPGLGHGWMLARRTIVGRAEHDTSDRGQGRGFGRRFGAEGVSAVPCWECFCNFAVSSCLPHRSPRRMGRSPPSRGPRRIPIAGRFAAAPWCRQRFVRRAFRARRSRSRRSRCSPVRPSTPYHVELMAARAQAGCAAQ